jgi:hypothetical protein
MLTVGVCRAIEIHNVLDYGAYTPSISSFIAVTLTFAIASRNALVRGGAFELIGGAQTVLRQYATKPHPNIVLVNNVCCSQVASVAFALELVMDAPVMLQAFGSASIPHASDVACSAAL